MTRAPTLDLASNMVEPRAADELAEVRGGGACIIGAAGGAAILGPAFARLDYSTSLGSKFAGGLGVGLFVGGLAGCGVASGISALVKKTRHGT